jgi:hypothetical protein
MIAGITLLAGTATATEVSQASLRETVRQSDAIVVGTVVARQSRWGDASRRWMQTDYTLAVEDVIYASPASASLGKTVVLTYWGGTIDGQTQEAADVKAPATGERVVVMLHERWAQRSTLAPTVGFNQGLFSVAPAGVGGTLVRDSEGNPVTMTAGGELLRGDAAPGAAGVDLAAFSRWLRANLPAIKREAPPKASKIDPDDPRILRTFAKTPAMPVAKPDVSELAQSLVPRVSASPETGAGVPAPSGDVRFGLATELAQPMSRGAARDRVAPKYSFPRTAHAPIVVNNFPSTAAFAPWSPED